MVTIPALIHGPPGIFPVALPLGWPSPTSQSRSLGL